MINRDFLYKDFTTRIALPKYAWQRDMFAMFQLLCPSSIKLQSYPERSIYVLVFYGTLADHIMFDLYMPGPEKRNIKRCGYTVRRNGAYVINWAKVKHPDDIPHLVAQFQNETEGENT